jgi:hypothetical protein
LVGLQTACLLAIPTDADDQNARQYQTNSGNLEVIGS